MAGQLTVKTRNKLLQGLGLAFIQLHSAEPGTDGTAAVVAGTSVDISAKVPATAVNGALQTTGQIDIDVKIPSGSTSVTISHYSLWKKDPTDPATVEDDLLATGALSATQSYSADGKYIVNTLAVDLNK